MVDQHLKAFGAVEVAGTMWSGKTWTSQAHAASYTTLDDMSVREPVGVNPGGNGAPVVHAPPSPDA